MLKITCMTSLLVLAIPIRVASAQGVRPSYSSHGSDKTHTESSESSVAKPPDNDTCPVGPRSTGVRPLAIMRLTHPGARRIVPAPHGISQGFFCIANLYDLPNNSREHVRSLWSTWRWL